jgi:sortase A
VAHADSGPGPPYRGAVDDARSTRRRRVSRARFGNPAAAPDVVPDVDELTAQPDRAQAAAAPARPTGDRVRTVVRGIGEVCITLGVLLLLMVVYQLFWTNVVSAQAISAGRDDLIAGWQNADPDPAASPTPMAEPAVGTPFALLYIPKMKDKVWGLPILQGTTKDELAKGAGHYVGTAMPGAIGNFAIAAHRSTHDEPFANIQVLQPGDKVYVRTKSWWYVYTLVKDDPNLSPTDVWVVDPVPGHPDAKPEQALLTMTTCTPRYGSTGRWAWWGSLTGYSQSVPDGLDVSS